MNDIDYNAVLPSQVRRQLIFEGLVGKDLDPAAIENILLDIEDNEPVGEIEQDTRLHTIKHRVIKKEPRYNTIYDSVRSTSAWRYCADAIAYGGPLSVPAAGGGVISAPVNFAQTPNLRTSQWPGAVSVYPVITNTILSVTGGVTTQGVIVVWFNGLGGGPILLGMGADSTAVGGGQGMSAVNQQLIPYPLTDPANTNIGTISAQIISGSGTAASVYFALQFAFAYLLPQDHPFDELQQAPFEYVESNQHPVTFP